MNVLNGLNGAQRVNVLNGPRYYRGRTMKSFLTILLSVILGVEVFPIGAAEAPLPTKAKPAAPAKGYVSFSNHNDLEEKAKKERKLRILVNMDPATLKVANKAFNQRYPFISLHAQEITGTDMVQRAVLEIKSGRAQEWDIIYTSRDLYSEYLPYLWKIDLLHMAERGVLQIPAAMIDPKNRNIIAPYTRIIASAFNKDSLSAEQLPKSWEDFLKPEFKGRKFAVDIGPRPIACLVPAWGLEKTLDFARKLATQDPIWVRGVSRTLPSIVSGEVPMMMGTLLHSVKRAQIKDRTGLLQHLILEPVPVYLTSEQAILATSQNRHAAILWLEWMASSESQKIADDQEPMGSSHLFRGGGVEQELRGKKLSWVNWEQHANMESWMAKLFQAYGFPNAQR
jgi:iron(III) transport system substrate-binding protein